MKIKELLNLTGEIVENSKIHFAIGYKEKLDPLYVYYRNEFQEWQDTQNHKNFEKKYILSLIYFGKDEWLFAGIFRRVSVEKEDGRYRYKTELTDFYTVGPFQPKARIADERIVADSGCLALRYGPLVAIPNYVRCSAHCKCYYM